MNGKNLFPLVVVTGLLFTPVPQSFAAVPEPFAGEAEVERFTISYDDWSFILKATVFEAGLSDRRLAPRPKPSIGRRTVKGNTSGTQLEGNRLFSLGLRTTRFLFS